MCDRRIFVVLYCVNWNSFLFWFFFFKNVTVFFFALFYKFVVYTLILYLTFNLLVMFIDFIFYIIVVLHLFLCFRMVLSMATTLCLIFEFFFFSFSKCLKKNLIQYSSFYANSNQIHIFNQSCFVFLFIYFFILLLTGFFWIFWIFLIFWFFLIFWIFFLLFLFFYLLLYVYSLFMLFCCWSHCFKFVDNNLVLLDRWVYIQFVS